VLTALRPSSQFVLTGEANQSGRDLPQLDDPRVRLASGSKSRTVRRTWLDTFDWRLFRAGLTLEQVADRGSTELVLTGRGGELVATATVTGHPPRWPCLVGDLPAGPLRERLTPVADLRALLPVARASSTLTELRAVNSDDKTIAIVAVDRMTVTTPNGTGRHAHAGSARTGSVQGNGARSGAAGRLPDQRWSDQHGPDQHGPDQHGPDQHGPDQPPARLAIAPLRGYQAQAVRLADALRRANGVAVTTNSAFEAALAATGRAPGDYSSKIDVSLTAAMPAALSLAVVLSGLLDTIEANVAGTVADLDTEFLHDLRVAVRRTRSVLKTATGALPAAMRARYRAEFKWLGDLTTPTRDLDVHLLDYPALAAGLVAASEADLIPFREFLQRHRDTAYRQLARGLRSARFRSLTGDWRTDLEAVSSAPARRPATAPFAAARIGQAHRKVLRYGTAIGPASPPQALHDLRKRCKELRYLLEVFASLYDESEHWRAVNELKSLQDCLGEFQDTDVQITELRAFATRMLADRSAPAETLLAMGEIAAGLGVRQRAARQEFAGRFAEFASPRGQARIESLARSAQAKAARA
jgi:CHAD domain-containing protein